MQQLNETYYVLVNQYGDYVNSKVQEYNLTLQNLIEYAFPCEVLAKKRVEQLKEYYDLSVAKIDITINKIE